MKKKYNLINGCSSTFPAVTPKSWKTGNKILLQRDWIIHFYFKDPNFLRKYPSGKQVRIKGMNEFKTLGERCEATQFLIDGSMLKFIV
ncbi:hypothetical protein SAMN04489761_1216 [Tenacibaculum sp. MAR_2009_124]|uniref:hypothetical protein n=1 Tax=Tenacibaculum sp. MAR_2009_124 TaxID=1250059 RepID=UPI00089A3944|nr:hypothetical protein [Tenacibaculum sp. MAR_2009_124]SEB52569.1 hypothetical protein SAMN04489761_1216 [Tenacibaculum sp. MAR_2009_124]